MKLNAEKKLSLCMIVHNEERWLDNCLRSIREAVDEIIIVDTGSTDRTRKIAEDFGAAVYDYPWQDNFSEARNYSLEQATGDWVLWLDADEEVRSGDAMNVRQVLQTDAETILLAGIHLFSYYGENPPDRQRAHGMNQVRMFRRESGFRFRGSVHEQLHLPGRDIGQSMIIQLPVTVYHYGYLDETVSQRDKDKRNMLILQQEKNQGSPDPWIDYHMASVLYRREAFDEAYHYVNSSISQFVQQGYLPPSLLYKLKYSILLVTSPTPESVSGIDLAIQLYPDYVDLYYTKGLMLFEMGLFREAGEVFQECIALGEDCNEHLTTKGAGSFLACYYLARCYLSSGNHKLAQTVLQEALILNPDYPEAGKLLKDMNP
ncbi:glycosyltransferase [Paenibacillus sp. FSL H8-0122]|uniref:glycosyltransferase n=1 Tax=Paenibacillus sp. FSL H8-0122 TaxID=2954510 RepID=UPI0030FBD0E1